MFNKKLSFILCLFVVFFSVISQAQTAIHKNANALPIVGTIEKLGTENAVVTFKVADFVNAFSDSFGGRLVKIKTLSLPDNGILKLFGNNVVVDQEIPVENLNYLSFVPLSNWFGSDRFVWNGSNGLVYAVDTANVLVNITIAHPTVATISKPGGKNIPVIFSAQDFINSFSDSSCGNLIKIQIARLPNHGTLELSGNGVTINQEIPTNNLGNLVYIPNNEYIGDDDFIWSGSDGTSYATNSASVNIAISGQYTNPTLTNIYKSGCKNTIMTFTAPDFTSSFSSHTGYNMVNVKIVTLPENGTLKLSGAPVEVNQIIQVDFLNNLTFVPTENWSGALSFSWNGSDGITYATTPAVVNVIIGNLAPILTDTTISGYANSVVAFTANDFISNFGSVCDNPLVGIKVLSLPSNGKLKLLDAAVAVNQVIPIENMNNLTFVPTADWSGRTSFDWLGHDGTLYATTSAEMEININTRFASWLTSIIVASTVTVTSAIATAASAYIIYKCHYLCFKKPSMRVYPLTPMNAFMPEAMTNQHYPPLPPPPSYIETQALPP